MAIMYDLISSSQLNLCLNSNSYSLFFFKALFPKIYSYFINVKKKPTVNYIQ